MSNRSTWILAVVAIGIIATVIGVGLYTNRTQEPPKPQTIQKADKPLPTRTELEALLVTEQSEIKTTLTAEYPAISTLYVVTPGKLYERGEWYGTTLTLKAPDQLSNSRDTLRVLMQKKDGKWTVRTGPPQLLLSTKEYPDVPKSVLQDINSPVSLPGTTNSPPIN
jgi:hypothetical protein